MANHVISLTAGQETIANAIATRRGITVDILLNNQIDGFIKAIRDEVTGLAYDAKFSALSILRKAAIADKIDSGEL